MEERDKKLITNFLVGGAGAGAAVAGVSSIVDYVKYLRNKAKMENEPDSLDNDTIYIDKKIPVNIKSAAFESGLAVAGGATAGLASYIALSKMYQLMKKKQLQKDLDEAQSVYTDTVTKQSNVGKPISAPELALSGGPIGALILAGLASGAITYQALRKQFPSLADSRKKTADIEAKPSRVETRYIDENGTPIKEASFSDLTDADYRYGMAFAGFVSKQANDSNDLLDAIYNTFSNDYVADFEELIAANDSDGLMEFAKQASFTTTELNEAGLAVVSHLITKSSAVMPLFTLAVFDTITDKSLYFFEKAASYDEETLVTLCKIASAMGQQMVKEVPALQEIEESEEIEPEEEEPGLLDDGSYISKIINIIKQNPEAFVKNTGDVVDKALS